MNYDGKKFKELRKYLDINQRQLAEQLGISQPYYSALEKGKRELSKKIVDQVKNVFNIDPTFFQEGSEDTYLTLKNSAKNDLVKWAVDSGIAYNVNNATKDKTIRYKGFYDENMIDFYYHHSEYRLDKLLSLKIIELKKVFEANEDLLTTIIYISGDHPRVIESFATNGDYRTYKNGIDKELKEFNSHIKDEKLYKAIRLNNYQQDIEHWYSVIRINISRMKSYKNTLKGRMFP